uniref:Uncharacterized protein n=1 Tax=Utricularia reniformis TaxID=192314 RepID=A0A1Y0B3D1_9LAMI|nr:hypothetical protein AEK19_MT1707 [Utricularia reniformis]ART31887.1 hypothetical protein AEK19_MT1707 [Utricularia reniformis]
MNVSSFYNIGSVGKTPETNQRKQSSRENNNNKDRIRKD